MDKDSAFSKILIGILFLALIVSGLRSRSLEREIEDLECQLEEIQYQSDDIFDCSYCDDHDYEVFVCCNNCDSHFPEKFAFMVSDDPICPLCVYEEFEYALSSESGKCAECGLFYERKWGAGYGLCEDCGDVLLSECEYCWERDLVVNIDGSGICFNCLKCAVVDMELESYLIEWCNQ